MRRLWNPIAPLIVWIIDKLKLINLEMHVREGRVDALRELARCPRLRKNRPLVTMLVHGALWHQYCSYIFLKVSSSLDAQGFAGAIKAPLGVHNENAIYLSHYLDFYPPLRSCHLPDPCVRRCVHAEPFSCLNRASGCFRDFGDHAGTALDS